MMVSSNADTFERGDAPSAGFLLEVKGLTRTFEPVHALKNVSFSVRRGEVVGLIGENGAGKSTLLNIISGTDSADAGTLSIRGNTVTMRSYKEANSHGVFRVFQELALLPNMTVWENLFLGHESLFSRAGVLDRNAAIQHAREIMHEYGHDWIDVSARVGDLPFPAQQLVEILKAFALARLLGYDEPIVLLDEPTTSLSGEEVEFLHRLIDTVRQQSAMVFVSHRLPELIGWSDRIVIMKDGELVGEAAADALTEDELHYRMVGRERKGSFYREDRQREPNDVEVLRVQSLSDDKHFRDVSLSVREGEIVGVAGVLGSGKNLLGRAIFGGSKISSGIVEYKGKALSQDSPRTSVRKGIGYVSADRKLDGMIETFSVGQNITVGSYTTVGKPLVKRRSERRTAVELIARFAHQDQVAQLPHHISQWWQPTEGATREVAGDRSGAAHSGQPDQRCRCRRQRRDLRRNARPG
ncbi:sugar ABC transporter ATP-binding protein [Mycobacterium sp. SMC-8]|nr:sugar ABC transporter ATP-binding protein [Mycobacterium sp. SMC-8]UXA13518.1 sugar ABC transporter ATP-binding protein [Mycobacterium sp. SMC-8]